MSLTAGAQRFFNLTVEDLRIDSLLPQFTYSVPLGYNYADSVYTVEILYPDFIDMPKSDIEKYHAITTDALPTLPLITTQTAVERKQGKLELSFVPMVYRNGKYQFLVSFMLKVEGKAPSKPFPPNRAPTRSLSPSEGETFLPYLFNFHVTPSLVSLISKPRAASSSRMRSLVAQSLAALALARRSRTISTTLP